MTNTSATLANKGEYKATEGLRVQVLAVRQQVLKEDHSHTLFIFSKLSGNTLEAGSERSRKLTIWDSYMSHAN